MFGPINHQNTIASAPSSVTSHTSSPFRPPSRANRRGKATTTGFVTLQKGLYHPPLRCRRSSVFADAARRGTWARTLKLVRGCQDVVFRLFDRLRALAASTIAEVQVT